MLTWIRRIIANRQRTTLPARLDRRRIYIIPSRSGLVFGFFLLAMLVAAINYTNNLAFLLTFLLGSIALVSSLHAYANLAGMELGGLRALPVSCGEEMNVLVTLHARQRRRNNVLIGLGRVSRPLSSITAVSMEEGGGREVEVSMPTTKRGLHPLGAVFFASRFPLGLFRAWAPLIPSVNALVYPRPIAPDRLMYEGSADVDALHSGIRAGSGGEFSGVRPYRPEDGPSRISWKASARGIGLFTKEMSEAVSPTVFFDWHRIAAADYEERISRLAGLVREAERQGLFYGMRLPDRTIPPAGGAEHAQRCLEALALMPEAG